jgi:hypothetical protein
VSGGPQSQNKTLGRVSHDLSQHGYTMYVALAGTLTTDMLGIES